MSNEKMQKIKSFLRRVLVGILTVVKFEKVTGKDDPMATVKRINNMKRIAVIVGFLIVALVTAILLLDGPCSGEPEHESVDIPGNVIDLTPGNPSPSPEVATSIELTQKDGYENIPFHTNNMLPGDSKTQYYCVRITHSSPQHVRFGINLDAAQKLSNVFRVRIENLIPESEDKLLYDGLMKDCTAVDLTVEACDLTVTLVYYRITVYTNGAEVGNEYAGESLIADFSWQLQ